MWTKIKAFFVWLGSLIWKALKQLWALISDGEWDLDPWKIGGIGAFILAAIWGMQVFRLAAKGSDAATLGILAGLVSVFVTVGTFLFNQSRKNDAALMGKTPTAQG
jgi:hypothetical protein